MVRRHHREFDALRGGEPCEYFRVESSNLEILCGVVLSDAASRGVLAVKYGSDVDILPLHGMVARLSEIFLRWGHAEEFVAKAGATSCHGTLWSSVSGGQGGQAA